MAPYFAYERDNVGSSLDEKSARMSPLDAAVFEGGTRSESFRPLLIAATLFILCVCSVVVAASMCSCCPTNGKRKIKKKAFTIKEKEEKTKQEEKVEEYIPPSVRSNHASFLDPPIFNKSALSSSKESTKLLFYDFDAPLPPSTAPHAVNTRTDEDFLKADALHLPKKHRGQLMTEDVSKMPSILTTDTLNIPSHGTPTAVDGDHHLADGRAAAYIMVDQEGPAAEKTAKVSKMAPKPSVVTGTSVPTIKTAAKIVTKHSESSLPSALALSKQQESSTTQAGVLASENTAQKHPPGILPDTDASPKPRAYELCDEVLSFHFTPEELDSMIQKAKSPPQTPIPTPTPTPVPPPPPVPPSTRSKRKVETKKQKGNVIGNMFRRRVK